jgi:hypothetical protein
MECDYWNVTTKKPTLTTHDSLQYLPMINNWHIFVKYVLGLYMAPHDHLYKICLK